MADADYFAPRVGIRRRCLVTPAAAAFYERAALNLTNDVADLRALLTSRDEDVRAYREALRQAIHALHELTVKRRRDAERYRLLADELRALRGTDERRAA